MNVLHIKVPPSEEQYSAIRVTGIALCRILTLELFCILLCIRNWSIFSVFTQPMQFPPHKAYFPPKAYVHPPYFVF